MLIYITGTSSGIGRALAQQLLNNHHQVIGLSRRQTIHHTNYKHVTIDLSNLEELEKFEFNGGVNDDVVLVNNAGTIGPIRPVGQLTTQQIIDVATLNTIALQVLTNKFVSLYQENIQAKYQVINISSGAGKRPIDAWSTYCASKASVDLFSVTLASELKMRGHLNWHVFSIAPGVVDTEMQSAIRHADAEMFLEHQKFVDLKNNNDLASPELVSTKLLSIITNPKDYHATVFSLRDINV